MSLQSAADLIRSASVIAVLTGAGVSKESGVPTFRDAMDGIWSQYDPLELATPDAFRRNPQRVWDWYQFRRGLVRVARPNPGHYALAELARRYPLYLVTQNVDDLHEQAGSIGVIHLHGNIAQTKCSAHCQGDPTLVETYDEAASPPPCPHCGAWLRPNVVWFHEALPAEALSAAAQACQKADVMLVVGTSGLVMPAAQLPVLAKRHGARLIEVNPDESAITPLCDIKLDGPSGRILPQLIEALDAHD